MATKLPIRFPTEAQQYRERADHARTRTIGQRLRAISEMYAFAQAVPRNPRHKDFERRYLEEQERCWRQSMKECITRHAGTGSRDT